MISTTYKDCRALVQKYAFDSCDLTCDTQQLIRIHQKEKGTYSKNLRY